MKKFRLRKFHFGFITFFILIYMEVVSRILTRVSIFNNSIYGILSNIERKIRIMEEREQKEEFKVRDLPEIEVGQMLLFDSKDGHIDGPVFYIKESSYTIQKILKMSSKLTIKFKDIIFYFAYSEPLLIMIKLGDNNKWIYGQWFNKYNPIDRELIKKIVFQDELRFCVIDNNNNIRLIYRYTNIYKISLWSYFKILPGDRKWSKSMFESDINAILSSIKTKDELFNIEN